MYKSLKVSEQLQETEDLRQVSDWTAGTTVLKPEVFEAQSSDTHTKNP